MLIYAANRHSVDLKMTKTIKTGICFPGIVVFAGKKPPEAPRFGSTTLVAGDVLAGDVLVGDVLAGDVLAGDVLARDVLAGDILAGDVLVGDVLAGDVLAGDVLAADLLVGDVLAGRGRPCRTREDFWPTLADVLEFIVQQAKVLNLSAGPQGCP